MGDSKKIFKKGKEGERKERLGVPIPFLSLLIHLSISTQAEHDESCNDKEASNDGTRRQGLIFKAPVHDGDDEDGQTKIIAREIYISVWIDPTRYYQFS